MLTGLARLHATLRELRRAHPLVRLGAAFARSPRGVAATEFALLLPILVALYAGAGGLAQGAMTSRRVEELSRTLVDLAAQQPTSGQTSSTPAPANATTQRSLQTILAAASALLAPLPLDSLTMTVSAVDITNNASGVCCVFKVRWSYTQGGTLRPCVNLTPVPATQAPAPSTVSAAMMPPLVGIPLPFAVPLLIADVSYLPPGVFSSRWLTLPTMQRTSYMLPRSTGQVIAAAPLTGGTNGNGSICF